jgi:hypothetical protein
MTKSQLETLIRETCAQVRAYVSSEVNPLEEHFRGVAQRLDAHYKHIEVLEARIAELEAKHVEQKAPAERWPKAV